MRGTKKSASFTFPTLARWQTSKSLPFVDTLEISTGAVKPQFPGASRPDRAMPLARPPHPTRPRPSLRRGPNKPNKLLHCRDPLPILRALFERNSDLCDVQKVLKRRSPWPSDSKSPPAEKSCAQAPVNATWRKPKARSAGAISGAPPRCIPRTCIASRRTSRSATDFFPTPFN